MIFRGPSGRSRRRAVRRRASPGRRSKPESRRRFPCKRPAGAFPGRGTRKATAPTRPGARHRTSPPGRARPRSPPWIRPWTHPGRRHCGRRGSSGRSTVRTGRSGWRQAPSRSARRLPRPGSRRGSGPRRPARRPGAPGHGRPPPPGAPDPGRRRLPPPPDSCAGRSQAAGPSPPCPMRRRFPEDRNRPGGGGAPRTSP